jgi:hypothetical protein
MQGLRTLYDNTGRPAAWRRLVDAVVPEFVDPTTEGALAGREELWSLVTEYRVRLAQAERPGRRRRGCSACGSTGTGSGPRRRWRCRLRDRTTVSVT